MNVKSNCFNLNCPGSTKWLHKMTQPINDVSPACSDRPRCEIGGRAGGGQWHTPGACHGACQQKSKEELGVRRKTSTHDNARTKNTAQSFGLEQNLQDWEVFKTRGRGKGYNKGLVKQIEETAEKINRSPDVRLQRLHLARAELDGFWGSVFSSKTIAPGIARGQKNASRRPRKLPLFFLFL